MPFPYIESHRSRFSRQYANLRTFRIHDSGVLTPLWSRSTALEMVRHNGGSPHLIDGDDPFVIQARSSSCVAVSASQVFASVSGFSSGMWKRGIVAFDQTTGDVNWVVGWDTSLGEGGPVLELVATVDGDVVALVTGYLAGPYAFLRKYKADGSLLWENNEASTGLDPVLHVTGGMAHSWRSQSSHNRWHAVDLSDGTTVIDERHDDPMQWWSRMVPDEDGDLLYCRPVLTGGVLKDAFGNDYISGPISLGCIGADGVGVPEKCLEIRAPYMVGAEFPLLSAALIGVSEDRLYFGAFGNAQRMWVYTREGEYVHCVPTTLNRWGTVDSHGNLWCGGVNGLVPGPAAARQPSIFGVGPSAAKGRYVWMEPLHGIAGWPDTDFVGAIQIAQHGVARGDVLAVVGTNDHLVDGPLAHYSGDATPLPCVGDQPPLPPPPCSGDCEFIWRQGASYPPQTWVCTQLEGGMLCADCLAPGPCECRTVTFPAWVNSNGGEIRGALTLSGCPPCGGGYYSGNIGATCVIPGEEGYWDKINDGCSSHCYCDAPSSPGMADGEVQPGVCRKVIEE